MQTEDSPHVPDDDPTEGRPPHTVLGALISEGKVPSVNELVAYNMTRARKERGWTQQNVAERLQRYTGRQWSNASISAAERSWQGGRSRKFDANELVALSVIFDYPVAYFLLPPDDQLSVAVLMAQPEDRDAAFAPVLPNRGYLRRVLLDRSPTKDDSLFFTRAQSAVRRHMQDEWHPPVFLSPDMVEMLHSIPVEPLKPEAERTAEAPATGISQDVEVVSSQQLASVVGEHVRNAIIDQSGSIVRNIMQSLEEQGMLVIKPTTQQPQEVSPPESKPGTDRSLTEAEIEQQPKPREL
jgi:transcriptional regulator with XRE-family HTH domain